MIFCTLKNDNLSINNYVLYDLYTPIIGLQATSFYVYLVTRTVHQANISVSEFCENLQLKSNELYDCIRALIKMELLSIYKDKEQYFLVVKKQKQPEELLNNEEYIELLQSHTSINYYAARRFEYAPMHEAMNLVNVNNIFINDEIDLPSEDSNGCVQINALNKKQTNTPPMINLEGLRTRDIFFSAYELSNFSLLIDKYLNTDPVSFLTHIFMHQTDAQEIAMVNNLCQEYPNNPWAINLVIDFCLHKNITGKLNYNYLSKLLRSFVAKNIVDVYAGINHLRAALNDDANSYLEVNKKVKKSKINQESEWVDERRSSKGPKNNLPVFLEKELI
ncbi:DnaD domain protein [Ureaplasma miroungigenitalium]|uniref:DnaD domain protein n=1 Tax=Ureaplasma miroungigenitalium TaxID=1042321 RepID=UPI0021E8EDA9|nr:DnaD domain protein [Ureaplasma miroungigenitalium]MCV3734020.1 DnaD domain protein [Ureaplasma miroungigenitalium]